MSKRTRAAGPTSWFPFYVDDWLSSSSVMRLELDEQGAYIKLLAFGWKHGGIPADHAELARILGLRPGSLRAARMLNRLITLAWKPHSDDPRILTNDRQEAERSHAEALYKNKLDSLERARKSRLEGRERASVDRPVSNIDNKVDDNLEANGRRRSRILKRSLLEEDPATEQIEQRGRDARANGAAPAIELWPLDDVPVGHRETVRALLRSVRAPAAVLANLRALESGMHPPRYGWNTIGRALAEMAAAGRDFSPVNLRAFCRRLETEERASAGASSKTERAMDAVRSFASEGE